MSEYKDIYFAKLRVFVNQVMEKIPIDHRVEGINGPALFYYLLHKATGETKFLQESASRARHSVISLATKNWERSACGGPAAEAWSLAFLHHKGVIGTDAVGVLDGLEESIYIQSLKDIVRERYSGLGNGGGAVTYALRRLPNEKAEGYLMQVVDILAASVPIKLCLMHLKAGRDFDDLPPARLCNVICISNILLRIQRHGLFRDKVLPLLEVCAHCLYYSLQSVAIDSGEYLLWENVPIGQLFSLFALSRVLDADQLRQEAEEVVGSIAWRVEYEMPNLSLKSGAAGLAHTLRQLHKVTGDPKYTIELDKYISKLMQAESIFQCSATEDVDCFLSGTLGIHAVLLESFLDNEDWWEFIHPAI